MKIIQVDNFDREGPGYDDRFVAMVVDPHIAEHIVSLLNSEHKHPEDDCFYKVVPNDYKLRRFEP